MFYKSFLMFVFGVFVSSSQVIAANGADCENMHNETAEDSNAYVKNDINLFLLTTIYSEEAVSAFVHEEAPILMRMPKLGAKTKAVERLAGVFESVDLTMTSEGELCLPEDNGDIHDQINNVKKIYELLFKFHRYGFDKIAFLVLNSLKTERKTPPISKLAAIFEDDVFAAEAD